MFRSVGILCFNKNLYLSIDPGIYDYYYSLIPKYLGVQRQKHGPHISINRHDSTDFEKVKNYINMSIEFWYDPYIYSGEVYYWLDAYSTELEKLKDICGFPHINYRTPKEGFREIFHITLGNVKKNIVSGV